MIATATFGQWDHRFDNFLASMLHPDTTNSPKNEQMWLLATPRLNSFPNSTVL